MRFNALYQLARPTSHHRCSANMNTGNTPVPDEQSDLTDLPIFAPHAAMVDQGHRARDNGGPIASLPTMAAAERRPVSLPASGLAGEDIDWGLVRSFRKQAAEICPTS
jgi:hypothetical protein